MSLFDEAETQADPMALEPDLKEVQGYQRKKFKGQRMELLKDIPHDKRLCTLDQREPLFRNMQHSVGEEFIRTEIEFIPAKVRVIDYYRETFECRTRCKNGKTYMEKSPMPYPVIQHSMASLSTVARVMHQKFVNTLPLYRQEDYLPWSLEVQKTCQKSQNLVYTSFCSFSIHQVICRLRQIQKTSR